MCMNICISKTIEMFKSGKKSIDGFKVVGVYAENKGYYSLFVNDHEFKIPKSGVLGSDRSEVVLTNEEANELEVSEGNHMFLNVDAAKDFILSHVNDSEDDFIVVQCEGKVEDLIAIGSNGDRAVFTKITIDMTDLAKQSKKPRKKIGSQIYLSNENPIKIRD